MPYLTPDAPTGNSGRVLVIPDTYVPSVNGALLELMARYNWEQSGTETPDQAVTRMSEMFELYIDSSVQEFSGMSSPITPYMWDYSDASVAPTWSAPAGMPGGSEWASGNTTINNFIEFSVSLSAGDWSYHALVRKGTAQGIMTISVDGIDVGTIDLYAASNQVIGVFLAMGTFGAGSHAVRWRMASKNASASAYGWRVGGFALHKDP